MVGWYFEQSWYGTASESVACGEHEFETEKRFEILEICDYAYRHHANKILGSCWHFHWNSHCPHAYSIEIFSEGAQNFLSDYPMLRTRRHSPSKAD